MMKITEGKNDEQIASYAYGIYGQLESSEFKGKEEAYLWDGLALVNRSGEEIVNDPAETGGNPVTMGGKILFNDMLGTTLGCFSNNQFQENGLTAFGAKAKPNSPEQEASFFTGKPYVEGLGYSFLYRNYRPDLGKWQTADPKGYPDGWNNFAYCNNNFLIIIDPDGTTFVEFTPITAYVDKDGRVLLVGGGQSLNDDYDKPAYVDELLVYQVGLLDVFIPGAGGNVGTGLRISVINIKPTNRNAIPTITEGVDSSGRKYKEVTKTVDITFQLLLDYGDNYKIAQPITSKTVTLNGKIYKKDE